MSRADAGVNSQPSKMARCWARRRRVADRYLEGLTQQQIADEEGVNQSTISRDLAAIREEWLQSALVDFDAAKAKELAALDKLEREAYEAWQRSCEAAQTTTTEKVQYAAGDEENGKTKSTARVQKRERDGNPQFLRQISWCIEHRCRILGLYEAAKLQISYDWRQDVPPEHQALAEDFFAQAAEDLAQRMIENEGESDDDGA